MVPVTHAGQYISVVMASLFNIVRLAATGNY